MDSTTIQKLEVIFSYIASQITRKRSEIHRLENQMSAIFIVFGIICGGLVTIAPSFKSNSLYLDHPEIFKFIFLIIFGATFSVFMSIFCKFFNIKSEKQKIEFVSTVNILKKNYASGDPLEKIYETLVDQSIREYQTTLESISKRRKELDGIKLFLTVSFIFYFITIVFSTIPF